MRENASDRSWVARPEGTIALCALLLAAVRTLVAARGYFYADDFGLLYRSWSQPLDLDFLLQSYNGHVNPFGWALAWTLQWLFPGSHVAISVAQGILWLLILLLTGYLVWHLCARVWVAAAAMILLSVTAFQWEVSLWWSAALYALPYQVWALLSLALLVRWRLGAPRFFAWWGLLAYALACICFTRGPLVLVLLYVAVVGLPWGATTPWGLRQGWRQGRRVWLGYIIVGASVAFLSASRIPGEQRPELSATRLARGTWEMLVTNVLPGLWGGPLRWSPVPLPGDWPSVLATPAPGGAVQGLALLASLVAVGWVIVRAPELRGYMVGALVWLTVVAAAAAASRLGNELASPAYRYTFDAVWAGILLLALLPGLVRQSRIGVVTGAGVGAVVMVLGLMSASVPVSLWGDNLGGDYVATARKGFTQPGPEPMLNQGVPAGLVDAVLLAPYASTRGVLGPQPGSPDFGDWTTDPLRGFDPDGRLETQSVVGPSAQQGPDPGCGYEVTSSPRLIALDGTLIDWRFYAKVAYFTERATTLNVAVGGSITSVRLEAGGLRAVFFPVKGPGSELLVSVGDPALITCVTEVTIGNRVGEDGGVVRFPGGGQPSE